MSNFANFQTGAESAVKHLEGEYVKLQAGRANAGMVEGIKVESYGTLQPMKAVATITIPDPKTIQIQPWDKTALPAIEKAIMEANLGVNPSNDGVCVRINLPQPTEERRLALVKTAKQLAEDAKISIRQARQHMIDELKAEELPEDELKGQTNKLQEQVDAMNKRVEEIFKNKEKDILTI